MLTKFSRSWQLVKASAAVLGSDKHLLVFPVLSTLASILVIATFVAPLVQPGDAPAPELEGSPLLWAWLFAFYVVQYFVIFFFNAALVGAALIRLGGGAPSVRDGLRIAAARAGAIFGYALIAATIGLLLRALEERLPLLGRVAVALIGMAWTVATFLTVPVLVSRGVGPIDAVRESAALLKRSWGENLIGNVGIGLVFIVLWIALALVAAAVIGPAAAAGDASATIVLAVALALVAIFLALLQAALQGVYSAALYRYAADGRSAGGFDQDVLAGAFRRK